MANIPQIKLGDTTYNIKDSEARSRIDLTDSNLSSLSQSFQQVAQKALIDRGGLSANNDVDDYTESGQWWATDQVWPTLLHWPTNKAGRLIVFGNSNASQSIKAQFVIASDSTFYYRYYGTSSGWREWRQVAGLNQQDLSTIPDSSSIYSDMDTFPSNSFVLIGTKAICKSIQHSPDFNNSGFVLTIAQNYTDSEPRVQFYFTRRGEAFAYRTCILNDGWQNWYYFGKVVEKFICKSQSSSEPGTFANLAWGLRYMMQHFDDWSEHHICDIEIESGTFDLSDAIYYINNDTLDMRGLFVTPYTRIHGAGKDKTVVQLMYNGNDADIMFNVSALNIPYESIIEDLTIRTKNLRYTVHSDNGITNMPDITVDNNKYLNNNQITLNNVKLIHEGFDADKTPAQNYKVPSCWGSGSFNNANQKFINCDFIAYQCTPWLNHNRTTLTIPSTFEFDNCSFVCGSTSGFSLGNNYSSCLLISWGASLKHKDNVYFRNCKVNRFITLSIRTDMGGPNAVCDYNVYIDNDLPVIEYTNNGSHYIDNYRTANTQVGLCTESNGILAYKPVSVTCRDGVKAYDSNYTDTRELVRTGIAICSAGNLEMIVYQDKGIIYIPLLTGSTSATQFQVGQEIGYEDNTWTVNASKKILKIVDGYLGEFII